MNEFEKGGRLTTLALRITLILDNIIMCPFSLHCLLHPNITYLTLCDVFCRYSRGRNNFAVLALFFCYYYFHFYWYSQYL